jgi:hypothetical protein
MVLRFLAVDDVAEEHRLPGTKGDKPRHIYE